MCACLCVNPFLFILDKRLGIDRLYIKCMFNFIRNYQIVLQSDCTILHNYQQYIRVLLTHIFIKTFFFSLLNFIHFRKWDVVVIMVLIYIWLMTCMMLNIFAYDFTNPFMNDLFKHSLILKMLFDFSLLSYKIGL